ncbi:MAG: membrane integrity-associated transporter subunit PqiC [Chromatiales bacterium]|jgi:uncharacterized protein|nr:membrane integrity-associated transporter subunit PqiC [Chromatiales bacterium]
MYLSPFVRSVALAAVLVSLAGCVPNIAETSDTRFYVLGDLPASTQPLPGAARTPPLTVDLAALTIPQYLQRPQIVTRIEKNQLFLSEFHNWGGSLEKNMMRVLASNLSLLLATPEIHIATRRSPPNVSARVEVEVMQFERRPDRRAVLSVQWRLVQANRDRTPIISKINILESEPVASASMDATVAAMSDLMGELSIVIAEAIVSHANG